MENYPTSIIFPQTFSNIAFFAIQNTDMGPGKRYF